MREIIVDLFAGGGGASLGIEWATGRSPDIAVNHDPVALGVHAANHPLTTHLPYNVWQVNPHAVCAGRPVGFMWASPDCKHFSKAKGGKPVKRNIRDLAWVVVRWSREVRPRIIMLENVEEFKDWGPLDENDMPCKKRKGMTFRKFKRELCRHGYKVEHREIRANTRGSGTLRKRLYMIARRDGLPIVWPAETHGAPGSLPVTAGKLLPWPVAADCIDWTIPCPSIFMSKKEAREHFLRTGVRLIRPLADATMARIGRGVYRFVIDNPKPFIVPVTHPRDERVHGIDESVRTVTGAKRGELALVMPSIIKFNGGATGQRADESLHTITSAHSETHPGAAAPLGVVATHLAPVISYAQHGGANRSPLDSMHTIAASSKDQNTVVAPVLARTAHGEVSKKGKRRGRGAHSLTESLPTNTASPDYAIATPFLNRVDQASGAARNGVHDPEESVRAIATAGGLAVTMPVIVKNYHGDRPDSGADESLKTILTGQHHMLIAAAGVVNTRNGEREGQEPRVRDTEDSMPTATAAGSQGAIATAFLAAHHGEGTGGLDRSASPEDAMRVIDTAPRHSAVTAFLAQHNTDVVGHGADETVSTIVQRGPTQGVVEAQLEASAGVINMKGSGRRQSSTEQPTPSQTAGGWHIGEVRAFLMKYHRDGGQHAAVDDGAPTIDCKGRLGLVTVRGVEYRIVDIGMRMLTPRELFRAQGFPDSYIIDRQADGTPVTKTDQIRLVGNSVCPHVAMALVAANYSEMDVTIDGTPEFVLTAAE